VTPSALVSSPRRRVPGIRPRAKCRLDNHGLAEISVTGEESSRPPTQAAKAPVDRGSGLPSDDRFTVDLCGFGPLGILAILVIAAGTLVTPVLGAMLVLAWARRSHTPWREIGYVRPKSWIGGLALGLAFGSVFKLLMKTVVMPLLGADPINSTYHYLVGNPAALPGILLAVIVGAGFGEETVFRGYLFERFGKLWGAGFLAKLVIVLLGAGLFALRHYVDQGTAGVQQAVITGLVFGAIFAITGRIWMLMCAHTAFDLAAIAIIYWNLESELAHFVFK